MQLPDSSLQVLRTNTSNFVCRGPRLLLFCVELVYCSCLSSAECLIELTVNLYINQMATDNDLFFCEVSSF